MDINFLACLGLIQAYNCICSQIPEVRELLLGLLSRNAPTASKLNSCPVSDQNCALRAVASRYNK